MIFTKILIKKAGTVLFALAFIGAGCGGCDEKAPSEPEKELLGETSPYTLSAKKVLAQLQAFSYSHTFLVTLQKDDKQDVNVEKVNIKGSGGRIHLEKKIDDAHFFEIFNVDQRYFVKNRLGPWHQGSDNKPMYSRIIDESLNALPWLIEQFSLKSYLAKPASSNDKKTIYIIENQHVSPDAPFLASLFERAPNFKDNLQSQISGRLEVDTVTNIPVLSRFSIELMQGDKKVIKLDVETKLAQNYAKDTLDIPDVVDENPLLYPVNIAPRFNDLMKLEQGNGK